MNDGTWLVLFFTIIFCAAIGFSCTAYIHHSQNMVPASATSSIGDQP